MLQLAYLAMLLLLNSAVNGRSVRQQQENELTQTFAKELGSYGVLFYTEEDGRVKSCAAQFVGHPKVLLTAAHCVYDVKNHMEYKGFIFARNFEGSMDQADIFTIDEIFLPESYLHWAKTYNTSVPYADYAFLVVKESNNKEFFKVMFDTYEYTGYKRAREFNITILGYPHNYGNYGELDTVETLIQKTNTFKVVRAKSPMGKGSCGGAWYVSDSQGNNWVISVTSLADGAWAFGPALDEITEELFVAAKNYANGLRQ